jgi:hypothetical protein
MTGKKPLRIYLSGGMEYAANEGRDWRFELQEWLDRTLACEAFNPNRESDHFFRQHYPSVDVRGLKFHDIEEYKSIVARLVSIDCAEIATRSDAVICFWDESAMHGAGTKGELTIAHYFNKPVYMVTSMPHEQIPGWVLACTTRIFVSFNELKTFLQDAAQNT